MELILALLSLLAAASGALTGVRAPEAGLQQTAQVDTVRTSVPRVARAARAMATRAAMSPAAPREVADSLPGFALARPAPLDAVRLIE